MTRDSGSVVLAFFSLWAALSSGALGFRPRSFSCGTACQPPVTTGVALLVARDGPEVRRSHEAQQATGPRGQGGAPAAKRGRTTLIPGWRLLRHLPVACRWWARSGTHETRQPVVGRFLRHSHVRGSEPQVVHSQEVAPDLARTGVRRRQRSDGDLACDGGWLARLINTGHCVHDRCGAGLDVAHLTQSSRHGRSRRALVRSR